jgi:hypothetical protein
MIHSILAVHFRHRTPSTVQFRFHSSCFLSHQHLLSIPTSRSNWQNPFYFASCELSYLRAQRSPINTHSIFAKLLKYTTSPHHLLIPWPAASPHSQPPSPNQCCTPSTPRINPLLSLASNFPNSSAVYSVARDYRHHK